MDNNDVIKHDKTGWHLDKRISVAHILATLSVAFALGSIIWALESRVTVVEQGIQQHEAVVAIELAGIQAQLEASRERDKELFLEWIRQNQDIIRRLERIEDGLNKHLEQS